MFCRSVRAGIHAHAALPMTIKVIEEYLNLSDAVHMERNLNMSIPNNSILKDGKIKN